MGQKVVGSVTALIIAANEGDAEHYALHELSFILLPLTPQESAAKLVSGDIDAEVLTQD
jgi:hypothetical protein